MLLLENETFLAARGTENVLIKDCDLTKYEQCVRLLQTVEGQHKSRIDECRQSAFACERE